MRPGPSGAELLRVLERRNFPVATIRALASGKSTGKKLSFRNQLIPVEELRDDSFDKIDIAFFSAGGERSRKFVPIARDAGAVVIDNSSTFRMDPDVPLVIPEINPQDVKKHRGVIANPNCTTAVALMAIYPLHRAFGVRRVFAASYQAVSGSGARAIDASSKSNSRKRAPKTLLTHARTRRQVYPHPIAFNVLPHVDVFLETGYTKEEMKMQDEGRKIMHLPEFRASVTCVRVPVYRAHSVAVSAEFERPVSVEQAREVLAKAPGLGTWSMSRRRTVTQCLSTLPAKTTARSGGSVAIARWKTVSRSGFRATNYSKARRSTQCRSRSCCRLRVTGDLTSCGGHRPPLQNWIYCGVGAGDSPAFLFPFVFAALWLLFAVRLFGNRRAAD